MSEVTAGHETENEAGVYQNGVRLMIRVDTHAQSTSKNVESV